MKILKMFLVLLVFLSGIGSVHAMTQNIDWNNLVLSPSLGTNGKLIVGASINAEGYDRNQYSLGFDIGGDKFRKFFDYNSDTKRLFTQFETGVTNRGADVPYALSIKDVQFNELFTFNGVLRFQNPQNGIISNVLANPQVTPIVPTLGSQARVPNASNNIGRLNKITAIPTNVSRVGSITSNPMVPTRAGVITPVQNQVVPMPVGNVIIPVQNQVVPMQKQIIVPQVPVQRYVPKYKSRVDEPKSINGIGNSKNYKSWRAQY